MEPAPWASPTAMEYFTPIYVPGIVYSVHMYEPHLFTHQGVGANPMVLTYPGSMEGRKWDKGQIRKVLQPVVDFQNAYKVHIYEEYNWDWAYHAFHEFHGWMAASAVENDYIHVLQRKLQAANPKKATELNVVGHLGKLSGGTIEQMNTVLEEVSAWKPNLVTIHLGENDRLNEIGKDGFEKLHRKLVDAFLTGPKRPTIACTVV